MFPRGGAINYNYKFIWLLRSFLIDQMAFHFNCGALSFSFTAAHGGSERLSMSDWQLTTGN